LIFQTKYIKFNIDVNKIYEMFFPLKVYPRKYERPTLD